MSEPTPQNTTGEDLTTVEPVDYPQVDAQDDEQDGELVQEPTDADS